jgi:hypothetical protein
VVEETIEQRLWSLYVVRAEAEERDERGNVIQQGSTPTDEINA